MSVLRIAAFLLLQFIASGAAQADTGAAIADPAVALRARFAALAVEREHNQFHRPLYIDSSESADGVLGEIHAILNQPFAIARPALNRPAQWCEILILHLNIKYCASSPGSRGTALHVIIGKKYDQPIAAAYPVDFAYRVVADGTDYLQVKLSADEGPLATSNYRILLEVAPAEDGRTLVRLSYSYSYGAMARVAMQVYLATVGRNKVGFAIVGKEPNGKPRYIAGMRGVTERNTMRYYLAIEAFLGALAVPADERMETSLRAWFTAIELYPRQLHEMEREDYLAMKRREYSRQQLRVAGAG